MTEPELTPRSPLSGISHVRRHGADSAILGAVLEERVAVQLATLTARRGRSAEVADAVRRAWGVDLPTTPRRAGGPDLSFAWSGPDQWLVAAEGWGGDLDAALRERAGELASVTAQGDGRVLIRLSGPRSRDLLSKGMGIDLHPRSFRAGDTALTSAAHVGVQVWQLDEVPTYELCAFRSFAGSLYSWLVSAGEEYGIEVAVPA